jgi:hypothetical protein
MVCLIVPTNNYMEYLLDSAILEQAQCYKQYINDWGTLVCRINITNYLSWYHI